MPQFRHPTLSIIFHMEPARPSVSWEEFVRTTPPRSIAVDGFVDAPPTYDYQSLHFNFDHHRGPPRMAMLCSSNQLREMTHDGLFDLLMPTGQEEVHVYMNDCDPDVCLCYYVLTHPWDFQSLTNQALNRLFSHIDTMDKRSGLVAMSTAIPIVGQAAWIFQDYWDFRFSGAIDHHDAAQYMGVLTSVANRIEAFGASRGQSSPINFTYETVFEGVRWAVVRESGPHARMKMAERGLRALVSSRQRPDGRWVHVLCRYASPVYWFPVPELGAHLSKGEEEGCHFGGGDTVMGNNYGRGSHRSPSELGEEIARFLKDNHLTPP